MANTLYPLARQRFLNGELHWSDPAEDYSVFLLSNAYTYDAAHEFADVLSGSILGTPQFVTGRNSLTDGVADADDLLYPDVTIGVTVARVVIVQFTGSLATSPLVSYADTNNDTTPISVPGSGAGIPLVWSSSSTRIFKL